MTDETMRGDAGDIDRIEDLLREMTAEDSGLAELPAELWDDIETQVRQCGDQANVVALDQRRRFSPRSRPSPPQRPQP